MSVSRKHIKQSLLLFAMACLLPNLHRGFAIFGQNRLTLFPYAQQEAISVQWYVKMLGGMLSFSCTMFLITTILGPVQRHLQGAKWIGHNSLLAFVVMWRRIFIVVAATSLVDAIHFILAFQRFEWLFLLQNGLFFLLTFIMIYKAFTKNR